MVQPNVNLRIALLKLKNIDQLDDFWSSFPNICLLNREKENSLLNGFHIDHTFTDPYQVQKLFSFSLFRGLTSFCFYNFITIKIWLFHMDWFVEISLVCKVMQRKSETHRFYQWSLIFLCREDPKKMAACLKLKIPISTIEI